MALDVSIPCQDDRHPARRRVDWCSRPFRPAGSTPAATACSSAPMPTSSSSRSETRSPPSRPAGPWPPAPAARCTSGPTSGGVGADFIGIPGATGTLSAEKKPQIAGVFTDLQGGRAAGSVGAHRRRHPLHHLPDGPQAGRDGARRRLRDGVDRGAGGAGPPGRSARRVPRAWRRFWRVGLWHLARRHRRHRHPAAVASHRRDIVRRRLQPDHRAGIGRSRIHRQLLPLLRRHRGAIRLVPVRAGAPGVDQHRRRVDATAGHPGRPSAPG